MTISGFFRRQWTDGEKWAMGIIATLLVAAIVATVSGAFKGAGHDQRVLVSLVSARPENTTAGGPEASMKELQNILENEVANKLGKLCFETSPSKDLYGTVSALIYKGSGGYANNVSLDETNIDQRHFSCIRDVFRGTRFPEATGDPETLKDGDTGQPVVLQQEYWITARIRIGQH